MGCQVWSLLPLKKTKKTSHTLISLPPSHLRLLYSPAGERITGCSCRCSPAGGNVRARTRTVPREVPTYRQGVKMLSPFRAKVSQKWNELMASRASLSMLVTLDERERLKELSRWSNGLAPRGGHTDRRTVRRKNREVKHLQKSIIARQTMEKLAQNMLKKINK